MPNLIDFDWKYGSSVVQLSGPRKAGWFHLSARPATWMLRSFGIDQDSRHLPRLADLDGDHSVLQQLSLREVTQLTGQDAQIGVDNVDCWKGILSRLDENHVYEPPAVAAAKSAPIPRTKLRQLYEVLELLTSLEAHLSIARELERAPSRLASWFQNSVASFAAYENDEHFQSQNPDRDRDLPGPDAIFSIRSTKDITALTKANGHSIVVDDDSLRFEYVDRELVLARTTGNALYEDGSSSRGGTRLDWLLKNCGDGSPTIAEVKVGNDKSPLYALLQLLMYAAELATPAQLKRLRQHYPTFSDTAIDEPEVGISLYIVISNYNYNSPIREQLLDATDRLARSLMNEPQTASQICRIACIEGTFTPADGLQFQSRFHHSSRG